MCVSCLHGPAHHLIFVSSLTHKHIIFFYCDKQNSSCRIQLSCEDYGYALQKVNILVEILDGKLEDMQHIIVNVVLLHQTLQKKFDIYALLRVHWVS